MSSAFYIARSLFGKNFPHNAYRHIYSFHKGKSRDTANGESSLRIIAGEETLGKFVMRRSSQLLVRIFCEYLHYEHGSLWLKIPTATAATAGR